MRGNSVTVIEDAIQRADLSGYDTYSGDCVLIATAIREVFGGELVASFTTEVDVEDKRPAHCAVRIDGTLYDGNGTTSEVELRDRAYHGGRGEFDEIVVVENAGFLAPDVANEAVVDLTERFEQARNEAESK